MGMLTKMLGSEAGVLLQSEGGSRMGPLMIGLFAGEIRLDLGEYEGDTSPQAVKRRFFETLGRQLGVSGQPKMIGDLAQAHVHPETGMCPGDSFFHWHWRPGRLGTDAHMRELGMKLIRETEGFDAHGCR